MTRQAQRMRRMAAWPLLSACWLVVPATAPEAATLRWTGLGASAAWSDAANWDALRAPGDGDALVFSATPPRADSVFDMLRSFASMSFAADAQAYALHVQGNGATLAFDGVGGGAGIHNLSAGTGPIRQDFYADAGTTGGRIVFSGQSGINLGDASNFRPVNLTARGAATATTIGGQILFQDQAATSGSTDDQLRAEGASAAGGVGGAIGFVGQARATRSAGITATGGTVLGAAGAVVSFADLARADAIINVLAGERGGLGARADFGGRALAGVYATVNNRGGTAAGAGAQAITTFRGDAVLAGSVNNEAGAGAGFGGGQLELRDRASHDSRGNDPSLGMVTVRNNGATVAGARAGSTVFHDDALVLGAGLLIRNAVQAEGAEAGAAGGTTEFRDRARAGQVTLANDGAAAANAVGGATFFRDQANAQGASIGNAGGAAAGGFGGTADFSGNSSAGQARIRNAAGAVAGTVGGSTRFSGQAVAGSATIHNDTALDSGGGAGGLTVFSDDSNAQQASITNQGGFFTGDNASTSFRGRASAGQARISNGGGRAAAAFGGVTNFDGSASAATATLVMAGGGSSGALGGFAVFRADSNADSATFDLRAASVLGAVGGRALFVDRSSAGSANISVAGSAIAHVLGPEAAALSFANNASAGSASINVGGNAFAGGGVGAVRFSDAAMAANATITLAAGQTRGGGLSFEGADASGLASAGSARIINQGTSSGAARGLAIGGQTSFGANSTAASASISNAAGWGAGRTNFFMDSGAGDASLLNLGGAGGEDGGSTQFNNSSSAQRANIVSRAGARGASGFDAAGMTRFVDQASAGQARITAEGAAASNAVGGLITFAGNAQPASATLVAEGGMNGGTSGGGGGRIHFSGLTNASQARVLLGAGDSPGTGGELDISAMAVQGVAIGSLEGGGTVNLGSRRLTVWSNTAKTSFSGLLRDGGVGGGTGGALSVTGGATLTLTGASTYSGGTRIGDGINPGSGKLVVANASGSATGTGEVVVARGGTLGGSGVIAGPVTLMGGGSIAPGDPVTLTLQSSLTWNGGGSIRLALGADSAGSDQLVVHSLVRGSDGRFVFEFIDFGMTVGATYNIVHFDNSVGFSAGDFSFSGLAGSFALRDGGLAFTTAAVPEPGSAVLLLLGLVGVGGVRRFARSRPIKSGATLSLGRLPAT